MRQDPSLPHVKGFEQIAVRQYMDADSRYRMAGPPACAPVIRLNCTQPLCFLDGVTFESVSIGGCFDRPNAALQVIRTIIAEFWAAFFQRFQQ